MADFSFLEHDETGLHTLKVISSSGYLNHWMFETILPYCSGEILEIGSGIGNISNCFIKKRVPITLSDIRKNYCEYLSEKYRNEVFCKGVFQIDIAEKTFIAKYPHLIGKFDTVFALNVIEHIKDDTLAIQNCYKLLKAGGSLVILVPTVKKLYNNIDKGLGHYRRYSGTELRQVIASNGFVVEELFYFNFVGIIAWFLSGNILKRKKIHNHQMKMFNFFIPLFRIFDKVTYRFAGLSLIAFAKKK